jgi:hypothetical protein
MQPSLPRGQGAVEVALSMEAIYSVAAAADVSRPSPSRAAIKAFSPVSSGKVVQPKTKVFSPPLLSFPSLGDNFRDCLVETLKRISFQ